MSFMDSSGVTVGDYPQMVSLSPWAAPDWQRLEFAPSDLAGYFLTTRVDYSSVLYYMARGILKGVAKVALISHTISRF